MHASSASSLSLYVRELMRVRVQRIWKQARQRVRAALVCAGASPGLTATVLAAVHHRNPRLKTPSQPEANYAREECDGRPRGKEVVVFTRENRGGSAQQEMEVKVPGEACGGSEWMRKKPYVRQWGSSAGWHRYSRLLDEGVEEMVALKDEGVEAMVALEECCDSESGRGGGELEGRRRKTALKDGGRGDKKRTDTYTRDTYCDTYAMLREHPCRSPPPGSPFSSQTSSPRSLPEPLSSAPTMALAVSSARVPRGPGYSDAVCASIHDGASEGNRTQRAAADRGVRATKAGQLRLKVQEALRRRVLLLWRAPCLARKASEAAAAWPSEGAR